jgi:hypothetical protein
MLDTLIIIAAQTTTIIGAIVIVSIKIEHRLTKIETDINWLKRSADESNCCEKESEVAE